MQFRILGLVEVRDEEAGLHLLPTGAKQRALLGALVVKAGHHVSVRQLIDELWGEEPPVNAENALQVHVARLRRLLSGPEGGREGRPDADRGARQPWIVTTSRGYTLRQGPVETDAACFQQLTDTARRILHEDPGRAGELLRRALSLWRGPALEGSVLGDICAGRAAQLEEHRLTALEMMYDAYLRTGRHGEITGELMVLTTDHPMRERFYDLLMVAFYRCGRQAEALRVYERARHRMVHDLGVEPGPALRRLMQAILQHDPALGPEARSLPSGPPPAVAPVPVGAAATAGDAALPLMEEIARLQDRIERLQREQRQLLCRFEELTGGTLPRATA
ncbi:DNA-binding SARP family transcriptional activator [Streptomyces sp. 3211.6]|uniref:BTAD domain-containing putative transcriptional regulator n=1 Tax=Streptomyces sp. 3211.6 TaxID=1938845 RepID=UPI000C2CA9C5|nr:BTAD domain-containing putative transcriptional regulator [Streptomyces sp. 3211.6]RKS97170.1 DNA-binding SARP family transcriptional activator [Streptomyces sp. 3211.6]